jgi:hypothetical protein
MLKKLWFLFCVNAEETLVPVCVNAEETLVPVCVKAEILPFFPVCVIAIKCRVNGPPHSRHVLPVHSDNEPQSSRDRSEKNTIPLSVLKHLI